MFTDKKKARAKMMSLGIMDDITFQPGLKADIAVIETDSWESDQSDQDRKATRSSQGSEASSV